jgi:hypothetical protein
MEAAESPEKHGLEGFRSIERTGLAEAFGGTGLVFKTTDRGNEALETTRGNEEVGGGEVTEGREGRGLPLGPSFPDAEGAEGKEFEYVGSISQ